MILLWFVGDVGRLGYYIYADTPVQFIIGGSTAVLLDLIVVGQFFVLRSKTLEDM